MTVKELKEFLNALPKEADDADVWFSVNEGEYYEGEELPAEKVEYIDWYSQVLLKI